MTPQKLIETAGVYKKLFASKLAQFDGELQGAFDEQVGKKQKQVEDLFAKNKQIDDDMRKLNEAKLKNEADAKLLGEEIQKNTADLTSSKTDWHSTYDDLIKEIDGHIELITKHLIN
jgi:flagellar capping protein FliD